MAVTLYEELRLSNKEKISFLDLGGACGWFTEAILKGGVVDPSSTGIIHDLDPGQCDQAETVAAQHKNVSVVRTTEELSFKLSQIDRVDVVFLNMVDLCQKTPQKLQNLYRQASESLKPGGALIITTQNPLARPGKFKYFETRKADPDDRQIITHIEGVDKLIVDYHYDIEEMLSLMNGQRLAPQHILTCDDDGNIANCSLKDLKPKDAQVTNSSTWIPIAKNPAPKDPKNQFFIKQISHVHEKNNVTDPASPILLRRDVGYMALAALNS